MRVVFPSDPRQSVLDVATSLGRVHRPKVVGRSNALAQLLHACPAHRRAQLGLTDQKALQQRTVAELEIRQHSQLLDSPRTQILRLVHNEQRASILRSQRREERLEGA